MPPWNFDLRLTAMTVGIVASCAVPGVEPDTSNPNAVMGRAPEVVAARGFDDSMASGLTIGGHHLYWLGHGTDSPYVIYSVPTDGSMASPSPIYQSGDTDQVSAPVATDAGVYMVVAADRAMCTGNCPPIYKVAFLDASDGYRYRELHVESGDVGAIVDNLVASPDGQSVYFCRTYYTDVARLVSNVAIWQVRPGASATQVTTATEQFHCATMAATQSGAVLISNDASGAWTDLFYTSFDDITIRHLAAGTDLIGRVATSSTWAAWTSGRTFEDQMVLTLWDAGMPVTVARPRDDHGSITALAADDERVYWANRGHSGGPASLYAATLAAAPQASLFAALPAADATQVHDVLVDDQYVYAWSEQALYRVAKSGR